MSWSKIVSRLESLPPEKQFFIFGSYQRGSRCCAVSALLGDLHLDNNHHEMNDSTKISHLYNKSSVIKNIINESDFSLDHLECIQTANDIRDKQLERELEPLEPLSVGVIIDQKNFEHLRYLRCLEYAREMASKEESQ